MQQKRVLSIRVDLVAKDKAVEIIMEWLGKDDDRVKLIATAYSEFFVIAQGNRDFRMALEGSDLVTPDGIGPLAAIYFGNIVAPSDSSVIKLIKGLVTGWMVLSGRLGEPVSGYWLFNELTRKLAVSGGRIFLLGGFGDTVKLLSEKLKREYPELNIAFDSGSQDVDLVSAEEDRRVVTMINQFKPDILFAAYRPVKQEIWLWQHKDELRVKVAMGVGGTFDEALGLVREAPVFFTRHGLKWFWRLIQQPQRLGRIIRATIVFAWLVFVESLRKR